MHFPQRFSPCRYPRATRAGGLSSRVSTQVCTHGPWNSQGPCCAVSPGAKQPLSLHVCLLSFFTITIHFIFSNKNKKIGLPFLMRRKKGLVYLKLACFRGEKTRTCFLRGKHTEKTRQKFECFTQKNTRFCVPCIQLYLL